MITMEKLREYGADVDEGLARCLNREALYIMLVSKFTEDKSLILLEKQLENGELDTAFEIAHAL